MGRTSKSIVGVMEDLSNITGALHENTYCLYIVQVKPTKKCYYDKGSNLKPRLLLTSPTILLCCCAFLLVTFLPSFINFTPPFLHHTLPHHTHSHQQLFQNSRRLSRHPQSHSPSLDQDKSALSYIGTAKWTSQLSLVPSRLLDKQRTCYCNIGSASSLECSYCAHIRSCRL